MDWEFLSAVESYKEDKGITDAFLSGIIVGENVASLLQADFEKQCTAKWATPEDTIAIVVLALRYKVTLVLDSSLWQDFQKQMTTNTSGIIPKLMWPELKTTAKRDDYMYEYYIRDLLCSNNHDYPTFTNNLLVPAKQQNKFLPSIVAALRPQTRGFKLLVTDDMLSDARSGSMKLFLYASLKYTREQVSQCIVTSNLTAMHSPTVAFTMQALGKVKREQKKNGYRILYGDAFVLVYNDFYFAYGTIAADKVTWLPYAGETTPPPLSKLLEWEDKEIVFTIVY